MSVKVAFPLLVKVPVILLLIMFGTPTPVPAVIVRFVIVKPAMVQPTDALTVPEIAVLPPSGSYVVKTVYWVVIEGLSL